MKKFLGEEYRSLVAGNVLGRGSSRETMVYLPDPTDYVVKHEFNPHSFQNVKEWEVWDWVRHLEWYKDWFAPCHGISLHGRLLVQSRTEPIPWDQLPKRVPSFFTDLKHSNWGLYKGRPVCHDYGILLVTQDGLRKTMKNARWTV